MRMDSYRGQFPDSAGDYDPYDLDNALADALAGESVDEDDIGREPPPPKVGQDERRMQVRAYNHWASLLGSQNFPCVQDLSFDAIPDLAPYAVMLDFRDGIEDPRLTYLGVQLAEECGASGPIARLSEVPARSLLSRITDHYMQILANEAPIGFEAEFVSQRDRTIVYRGILLPFSEDGATICQILGVINWKELADQATTDALLAEIDRTLAEPVEPVPDAAWAETPADLDTPFAGEPAILDLADFGDLPFPGMLPDAPLPATIPAPLFGADEPQDLAAWLASARALAEVALVADERSHAALYAAIGRAWDFALAAGKAPAEYAALLAAGGIVAQQRAPLTPIVKLVFGADYDKTRLTEYATALAQAQRLGIGQGQLAGHLASAPGGLKGVVQAERRLKREARAAPPRTSPREGLARKLRRIAPRPLAEFAGGSGEFAVLLARRLEDGELVLIGEAGDDAALVEKIARRVLS
jgi:hypothetical protein